MKKMLLILCSLIIYSCQSKELKEQPLSAQDSQLRHVSNARLEKGDKFRIKVIQKINISYDNETGYCGDIRYGAKILMKECTRYDRHIPAGTEFDTELSADLRSLLVTSDGSSIHSIVRDPSDTETSFISFKKQIYSWNSHIRIINHDPTNLGKSTPVH